MHMQMINNLPSFSANIESQLVSVFCFHHSRYFRRRQNYFSNNISIFTPKMINGFHVFSRHNQNMSRRFRMNVFERDNVIVFKNNLGRNFFIDDFAQNAIHIITSSIFLSPLLSLFQSEPILALQNPSLEQLSCRQPLLSGVQESVPIEKVIKVVRE